MVKLDILKNEKFKKYSPAVFFVCGFLFDIITLDEVDNLLSLIQQCLYISFAGFILRFSFLQHEGLWVAPEKMKKIWKYQNEIIHFLLGGLLSVYTLFYFVSSSFSVSFFFLFFMFAVLVLNETPALQNKGLFFKYLLYSICLFSFFMFLLPLLSGSVSSLAFYAALIVSGLILALNYFDIVKRGVSKEKTLKQLVLPGVSMALILIVLYVGRILPPVPLATKYMGIYHSIDKTDDRYQLGYTRGWWRFWQNGDQTFNAKEGDKVYCFVRIFAPSAISEKIIFHWQAYEQGQWESKDRVAMKINGGRLHGFRAYAVKANFFPADWRVKLETEDGRELSRINFEIVENKDIEPSEYNYHYQ
ncbi:MAG: DUF2914 domain-containing protein [Bdellovibrionaceae bacterium]|nr:DUF2914 domain-containing protein [Pseudobdellovibrionaceae bacterium]